MLEKKGAQIESTMKDKMATQAMLQREIQMAINIAKARDSLMWFGSLYACVVTGATVGVIARRPVPPVVAVPIVMGGFALTNMFDMAYGNKLQRVVAEAESIMINEKHRFVPPSQAPFYGKYDEALVKKIEGIGSVGSYWPEPVKAVIDSFQLPK